MDSVKERIVKAVDALAEDLYRISDYLKDNPELGYAEQKASEYLTRYLNEQGFEVEKGVGGLDTAFRARPSSPTSGGPSVAFLAEYDALAKLGHGCGHNMIAAVGVGAFTALAQSIGDNGGNIALVGTPAEEGGGGKVFLAEAGVFEGMDAAMMFHPSTMNLPGKGMLGRNKFRLEFHGKTAHASGSPDKGINALDALVLTYNGINAMRQHLRPDGRIHGIITHGGDAPNIIPDYAAGLFYVRAGSIAYRDELFERVKKCAEGACLATGATFNVEIDRPVLDPFKRNLPLEGAVGANIEALGLKIDPDDGRRGSSDIGNLSYVLPSLHFWLSIAGPEVAGHSVEFCEATVSPLGRKTLLDAAKALAMTAYDFLSSESLRREVKEAFDAPERTE